MSEWIKACDKLPDLAVSICVCGEGERGRFSLPVLAIDMTSYDDALFVAQYISNSEGICHWEDVYGNPARVTHWMHAPKPPGQQ
jgi:hypothetical protein